jgi:hypothetical protein
METRDQMRGHCQGCGRLQAANPNMAQHGYTVEAGYFNGVCYGARHAPLEKERDLLDATIVAIAKRADEDEDRALRLEQREEDPIEKVERRQIGYGRNRSYEYIKTPYAELDEYEKRQLREVLVWELRRDAKHGRAWIKDMQALAETVHGKPLQLNKVRVGPIAHYRGGHFGVQCAASRYGAQRIWNLTDNWDRVTCAKCLKDRPV